jgi:hypothetical protein
MNFSTESELQAFMQYALGGEREVSLGSACRIDLRTNKYDIEIKPYLSPSVMDKAAGQLSRYCQYSGGRLQVIAGCSPARYDESLERLADAHRAAGIEVWFVDQMKFFQDAYDKYCQQDSINYCEEDPGLFPEFTVEWWKTAAALIGLVFVLSFCATPKPTFQPVQPLVPKAIVQTGQAADLRVRSSPSLESKILAQLANGTSVDLTGRASNGWAEIRVDGRTGWVSSNLITTP